MRRFTIISLAIFFSVESLFPHVDLSDITNLRAVFEHYREHKLASPAANFLTFLSLHYGDSSHWDIDAAEHGKLPFSKRNYRVSSPQISENSISLLPFKTFHFLRTIDGVRYFENIGPLVSESVWQPPRA